MDKVLRMFVDGACVPNPGKGGYAYLLQYDNAQKVDSGIVPEDICTNQRAEIYAAIRAFEALKVGNGLCIVVTSDSQYLINTMSGKFKKGANVDLWRRLDELSANHTVSWNWVRGHSGHTENEMVDELANKQALKAYRENRWHP